MGRWAGSLLPLSERNRSSSYAGGGKIPYQALATQNTPDARPVSPAVTRVNLSGARILSPGFGGEKYSLATHIIASIANKPAPRFNQAAVTLERGNDLKQTQVKAKEDKAIESNATFFEFLISDPCDIVYCSSNEAKHKYNSPTTIYLFHFHR